MSGGCQEDIKKTQREYKKNTKRTQEKYKENTRKTQKNLLRYQQQTLIEW